MNAIMLSADRLTMIRDANWANDVIIVVWNVSILIECRWIWVSFVIWPADGSRCFNVWIWNWQFSFLFCFVFLFETTLTRRIRSFQTRDSWNRNGEIINKTIEEILKRTDALMNFEEKQTIRFEEIVERNDCSHWRHWQNGARRNG